jgi:TolA-binding protein
METQDASAAFLIKFWPWFEAKRKQLLYTAVAVVVILFVWYFITTQSEQKAIDAGQAFTQLQLNLPANPTPPATAPVPPRACRHTGPPASRRHPPPAAPSVLFGAGRYEDAQAQFQKFLGANRGSSLAAAAQLGVAASLEAQNKPDLAATAYRAVTTSYPNSAEALPARFSLARVLESQGKLSEASSYYQEVARSPLAGSMASEAAQRAARIAPAKPAGKS